MQTRIIYGAFLAALLSTGLAVPAFAQIEGSGMPVSFSTATRADIHQVNMPPVDLPALLIEDSIDELQGRPYRFGYGFEVDYNLDNSGTWETLPDGSRLWRLQINCPGAYSINLLYRDYWLPDGARLFLYSEDRSMVIGAFTANNNKENGHFATRPVRGDVTIVEYHEPADVVRSGRISVSRVVHGYKDIFGWITRGYGDSGPCNNNVNCSVGDPWRSQIRSVAMILLDNGTRWCTGALVNNEREDETQYFLTAFHCGDIDDDNALDAGDVDDIEDWIIMFNYESPTCTDQDGPTDVTVQGTVVRASNNNSDVLLVEISETIPADYVVYYSGWDAQGTPPSSAVGIHHPRGDIKKISFENDALTSTEYGGTAAGTTHWRVADWDDGTTEPGSSGSPLYDPAQRIVGQLHGGGAACGNDESDWYGKFSTSWDAGGSAATRLRDWLDPDNTGTDQLDGLETNEPPVARCTDVTVSADENCEAVSASVDNGSYDPNGSEITIEQTPSGPYQLGETVVTLEVTDPQGLSATCEATVTVVDDTPPEPDCPSDITVSNEVDQCSAVVSFSYDATDNCPGVSVIATPASGSTFPVGVTPVQVLATDAAGNTNDCYFDVIVVDTQKPVVTCPETIEIEFVSPHEAVATFEATATDNCPDPQVSCTPPSGSVFPIGENTVICVATDASGNTDTCSFSFHLVYLDIKPRSCPNPLRVKPESRDGSGGSFAAGDPIEPYYEIIEIDGERIAVIPVAILGTDILDVRDLEIEGIMLNGVEPLRHAYEDVATPAYEIDEYCGCTTNGPDGYTDLTLKFDRDEVIQSLGAVADGDVVQVLITGFHSDHNPFFGGDCFLIRSRGPREEGIAEDDESGLTEATQLLGNNPNPFNPMTDIRFQLAVAGHVQLTIYNIMGEEVARLADGPFEAGEHTLTWNASQVASGIYLYRLETAGFAETKKMILLK